MVAEVASGQVRHESLGIKFMAMRINGWWRAGMPGAGVVCAVALLLGTEALLHSDVFMHRLRSVFAVGRAYDKVLYVEQQAPRMLVLGNSRVDNAIDPRTLGAAFAAGRGGFNLGLPGANASALLGIAHRFDERGLFGRGKVERVLIGLDESLLHAGDALGYDVFFGQPDIWEEGAQAYLRSTLRLWGYADNLKQLREPAKLVQFATALTEEVEPVGGGAAERLGYRPGFGDNQDAGQVARQEAGSTHPPDPKVVADFWSLLDLLERRQVSVVVVFPPLLNRRVLYLEGAHPASSPYLALRRELLARGVPMFALSADLKLPPEGFVNAGHLNDLGAQYFSRALGRALSGGTHGEVERVGAL